jgi:predicted peptidase
MKPSLALFGALVMLGPVSAVHLSGAPQNNSDDAQLIRVPYTSAVDHSEREFFLYLPRGYGQDAGKKWPVLVFLHGDGERGDTSEDLDYVLKNGPLYEAWVQKKDLPFIIITPQLWLFGRDVNGPDYLVNRTRDEIPQRLEEGIPEHTADAAAREDFGPMIGALAARAVPAMPPAIANTLWDKADPDVLNILDSVLADYQADDNRVYLTGVSLGGFGTWYYASQYPDKFAALVPVVGYGTLEQAEVIGSAGIPVWAFSGGRDAVVQTQYFFAAMNRLEELGDEIRFTTEQDMSHDVWNRVYARQDVYDWLLSHAKD